MPLLDTNAELDAEVFRNIVSLRSSANLFDDLTDDAGEQAVANVAEMRVRPEAPSGVIQRGFAYSAAIHYPFQADHLCQSRYSDGSYPVWYGALEEATALHETAWHALQQVRQTPAITQVVQRERAVWRVHAKGVFIDLRGKLAEMPTLVAASYAATQALGKQLAPLHPGIVVPSARRRNGGCLAAFTATVLEHPRYACALTYRIDPDAGTVVVERAPGRRLVMLREGDLCWE